MTYTRSIL